MHRCTVHAARGELRSQGVKPSPGGQGSREEGAQASLMHSSPLSTLQLVTGFPASPAHSFIKYLTLGPWLLPCPHVCTLTTVSMSTGALA